MESGVKRVEKGNGFFRRYRCYLLAALTWVGAVWLLWYFQEKVYDGSIETSWWRWIVLPAVLLLAFCLGQDKWEDSQNRQEKPTAWQKQLGERVTALLWMLCSMLLIWQLLTRSRYDLDSYIGLALFAAGGLLCCLPQANARMEQGGYGKVLARVFTALFTLLITVTLLYFAIARPATIPQGRRLVEAAGYTEVFYARPMDHGALVAYIFPGSYEKMTEEEYHQGYYLFQGQREGEDWGVVVSLYRPRIVEQARLEDNSELRSHLARRERS